MCAFVQERACKPVGIHLSCSPQLVHCVCHCGTASLCHCVVAGHTAPPLGGAGSSGSRSGIFSRGSSSRGGAEGSATSSSVASSSLAGSGSSSSRHAAGTKASGFSVGSGRRASSVGIQPTQLLLSRSALAAASASASSGHAGGPHGTQPGSLAAAAQLDAQMVRQGRIVEVELDHHYERGLEPLAENFLEGGVFSCEALHPSFPLSHPREPSPWSSFSPPLLNHPLPVPPSRHHC